MEIISNKKKCKQKREKNIYILRNVSFSFFSFFNVQFCVNGISFVKMV